MVSTVSRVQRDARMLDARSDEVGMPLEPPKLPFDPVAYLLLGLRAEVWEPLVLQRGPDHLVRVELGSVGREPSGLEPPPSLPQEGL